MPYDLSKLNLPSAQDQPAPQSKGNTGPVPDGRYDLSKCNLPESVEIPGGDGKPQKILIKDFGNHTRVQVEAALNRSDQAGVNALFRAIGTAKGSGLLSGPALERFNELGQGFLKSENPKLFFDLKVVSFLNGLNPEKRSQ